MAALPIAIGDYSDDQILGFLKPALLDIVRRFLPDVPTTSPIPFLRQLVTRERNTARAVAPGAAGGAILPPVAAVVVPAGIGAVPPPLAAQAGVQPPGPVGAAPIPVHAVPFPALIASPLAAAAGAGTAAAQHFALSTQAVTSYGLRPAHSAAPPGSNVLGEWLATHSVVYTTANLPLATIVALPVDTAGLPAAERRLQGFQCINGLAEAHFTIFIVTDIINSDNVWRVSGNLVGHYGDQRPGFLTTYPLAINAPLSMIVTAETLWLAPMTAFLDCLEGLVTAYYSFRLANTPVHQLSSAELAQRTLVDQQAQHSQQSAQQASQNAVLTQLLNRNGAASVPAPALQSTALYVSPGHQQMLGDQRALADFFDNDGKYLAAFHPVIVLPPNAQDASSLGNLDASGACRSTTASYSNLRKAVDIALRHNESLMGSSVQGTIFLSDAQKLALFKWQWGEGTLSVFHLFPTGSTTIRTIQDRLVFAFRILTAYTMSVFGTSFTLCLEAMRSSVTSLLFSACGPRLTEAFLIVLLDRLLNEARVMATRTGSQQFFSWLLETVCSFDIRQQDVHLFLMSQPSTVNPSTPAVGTKRSPPVPADADAPPLDPSSQSKRGGARPAATTAPRDTRPSRDTPHLPRKGGAVGGGNARGGGAPRARNDPRPDTPSALPAVPAGAQAVCHGWICQRGACANTDQCANRTPRNHHFNSWPPSVAQQYTKALLARYPN
jgi:hypothetical protein